MQTSKPFLLCILGAALTTGPSFAQIPAQQPATNPAPAPNGVSFLDDEAEAGGFDVTATLKSLPAEMLLAVQGNGDAYHLKFNTHSVELTIGQKGAEQRLALVSTSISPGSLVVQRRGARWSVINNNRLVLQAEDDRWHQGKIGFRGGLEDGRVQPVEDVRFDDDFMRVAADVAMAQARQNPRLGVRIADVKVDETLWRVVAGGWATTGLSENDAAQVAQSANPFVFKTNTAGTNLALSGRPFWSDYSVEASVKPEGASAIGLAVYAQDAKNYLLFHWKAGGPMQLRGIVDGVTRVLDEAPGGFDQKQWYRLRFSVAGGTLRAFVDDAEVLRARTGLFGRGQIGVYAESPTAEEAAMFDDVSVRSSRDFHDDFAALVPGRWQTIAGTWKMGAKVVAGKTASTGQAAPEGARGAMSVMGEADWTDYVTSAQLTLPADSAAGLVLHHQSGKGAYLLRLAGSKAKLPYAGKVQIVKIAGNTSTVLAEAVIKGQLDGKTGMWNFSDERGYLKATLEGKRVLDAFDETFRQGRTGLFAQRGTKGTPALRTFSVEFPRPRPTWAKVPDLYEQEQQAETMGGWSTPEGFWSATTPITAQAGATPVAATTPGTTTNGEKVLWHKGAFWGDGSVRFTLPALTASQSVALIFDRPGTHGAGDASLLLTLRVEGGVLKAVLSRNTGTALSGGQSVAKGQVKLSGAITAQAVEVEQRGDMVILRSGAAATTPEAEEANLHTLFAARVR